MRTAWLLQHLHNHLLRHQKSASQMNRQHLVEGRNVLPQGRRGLVCNARVVDQRIDSAMLRHHLGNAGLNHIGIGHITSPS